MYHLGPARGTSFHTAIIPDRTKIATAFSSPLPHFFLPVPGAFWCISPRPAGKISGAGGAPPRLRRPKQVPVREKTKKITFLLFFQGKIYYTIRDCIRTASRALAHGVVQPPAFFREEAACFGAATDEKIRPAYRHLHGGRHRHRQRHLFQSGKDPQRHRRRPAHRHPGLDHRRPDRHLQRLRLCRHGHPLSEGGGHGGLCRGRRRPGLRLLSGLVPGRGLLSLSDQHPGLGVRPLYLCPAGLRHRQRRVHDHHPVLSGGRLLHQHHGPPSGRQAPGLHDPHQAGPHPAHGRDGHCGRAAERHDRRQLRPGHRRHRYRLPPLHRPGRHGLRL